MPLRGWAPALGFALARDPLGLFFPGLFFPGLLQLGLRLLLCPLAGQQGGAGRVIVDRTLGG